MANIQKVKRGDVVGLLNHDTRSYEHHSNSDIRSYDSYRNYDLISSSTPLERYKKRISEVYVLNRKDVNTLAQIVVTLPPDVAYDDRKKFFIAATEYFSDYFGDKNMISAIVHMDESTPHLHIKAIPVYYNIKKQREQVSFDAKCPRSFYQNMHRELSEKVKKELGYEVKIENGATKNGNKTIEDLKKRPKQAVVDDLSRIDSKLYLLQEKSPEFAKKGPFSKKLVVSADQYLDKERENELLKQKIDILYGQFKSNNTYELSKKLEQTNNTVATTRDENQKLHKKIIELTSQNYDLSKKNENLNKKINTYTDFHETVSSLEEYENRIYNLQRENKRLTDVNEELEKINKTLKTDNKYIRENMYQLRQELDAQMKINKYLDSQSRHEIYEDRLNKLKEENNDLQRKNDLIQETLTYVITKISDFLEKSGVKDLLNDVFPEINVMLRRINSPIDFKTNEYSKNYYHDNHDLEL